MQILCSNKINKINKSLLVFNRLFLYNMKKENREDWCIMYCDTAEQVKECLTDKTVIWLLVYAAAKKIILEKRITLIVLEVKCKELPESSWVFLKQTDLLSTLNKYLEYKLEREEYEDCAEIKKLIDSINI